MTEMSTVLGEPRGTVCLPRETGAHEGMVTFTVKGDCMTPGIRDGDVIAVDPSAPVQDGDVAVVKCKSGGGVKRVYRDGPNLRLEMDNPAYEPITLTPEDEPVIIGRVALVIHFYE